MAYHPMMGQAPATKTDGSQAASCPFCGENGSTKTSSEVLSLYVTCTPDNEVHWVQCDICSASGPSGHSHDDALDRWNNRETKMEKGWITR